MASYSVNPAAVDHARELIDARQYVLDSDWGEAQPNAEDENRYLETPLVGGLRRVAPRASPRAPTTRRRPATPSSTATSAGCTAAGLIACVYRASEWRHKEVELAAHDLLQHLDATSG